MTSPKRTHYIFVDFENTQAVDLELIKDKPAIVVLLIGEKQKHLPITLVRQLLTFVEQVQLIESAGSGKNTLDFILACEVGCCLQKEPHSYFHIVSKDKGFDPLIAHLRRRKILAARHDSFHQVPLLSRDNPMSAEDKIRLLTERFIKHAGNRPAKRQTLLTYIHSTFAKQLPDNEVQGLIHNLEQRKLIMIDEKSKVTYHL